MTRKTALKRMINGQAVFHESDSDVIFFYDERQEKDNAQSIRVRMANGNVIGGVLAFFSLPNLGWKTTNQHFS